MPGFTAFYTSGLVVCLALTLLYVFLRERRRHTTAATRLQTNLAKLNLYWSDSADAVVPLETSSAEDEARRSQRTIGYTGLLLSLLSWAGVFFLLMIMLSERFLARSRREKNLFASPLTQSTDFDSKSVMRVLDDVDALNESPAEAARPI